MVIRIVGRSQLEPNPSWFAPHRRSAIVPCLTRAWLLRLPCAPLGLHLARRARKPWSIDALMRRKTDLVPPRFHLQNQLMISDVNKLAPKSPLRLHVPIAPQTISLVRNASMTEINWRFSAANICKPRELGLHCVLPKS